MTGAAASRQCLHPFVERAESVDYEYRSEVPAADRAGPMCCEEWVHPDVAVCNAYLIVFI
jgi:hypothetical protein